MILRKDQKAKQWSLMYDRIPLPAAGPDGSWSCLATNHLSCSVGDMVDAELFRQDIGRHRLQDTIKVM